MTSRKKTLFLTRRNTFLYSVPPFYAMHSDHPGVYLRRGIALLASYQCIQCLQRPPVSVVILCRNRRLPWLGYSLACLVSMHSPMYTQHRLLYCVYLGWVTASLASYQCIQCQQRRPVSVVVLYRNMRLPWLGYSLACLVPMHSMPATPTCKRCHTMP